MKKVAILLLIGSILSCTDKIKGLSDFKSDFYELQAKSIHLNDELEVQFLQNQDKIDSVSLILNGKPMKNKDVIHSENAVLGINELEIYVYLQDKHIYGKTQIGILSPERETAVDYQLINEYPHFQELFTQGFFFHDNKIYESSGQYGKSKLVAYALGSSQFIKETKQEPNVFSEGATLFQNKIYQLTFRERKIFVYDATSLELIKTLEMPSQLKEGWGMTSSEDELILSDGTQNIFFFDENLNYKRRIQVTGNVSIYNNINEMEYINGKIFANVWQTPYILIIDPKTGRVEHYYDLNSLNESRGSDDVLNGIALYGNTILVTGKNWRKIYELTLPEIEKE